jgi:hypothetical protein
LQFEATVSVFNIETAAGKGILECRGERFIGSNFEDGLDGGREIAAIVMQDWREGADLSCSRR